MAILESIAALLGSAAHERPTSAGEVSARADKPVLQLNRFPVTLDPGQYRNARSGSRPGGDLNPLFAFRELVDAVPAFTRHYSESTGSIERIYESLLTGASVDGDAPFAAGVLAEAKKRFAAESFVRSDGLADVWRPVYATPEDWCDAGPERFQSIDIDVDALGGDHSAFAAIGSDEGLQLCVDADPQAADGWSGSKVRGVRVDYLLVGLRRPWLHPLLFDTGDWFLSGQDAGFCSSGDLAVNRGVLPLITTGMLLGRNVEVAADWSAADAAMLDRAKSKGRSVALGPFLLSSPGAAGSTLHVIGWTGQLVPFSPKVTRNKAGSIRVRNTGAFVVRFSVEWREGGTRKEQHSGTFPIRVARDIDIPVNSTQVLVKLDVMTMPPPFETWTNVASFPFDRPVVKAYELSGTSWNPNLKEL